MWAAGFVSQLGDWMMIIGRAVLAFQLTGRASSVGIVYFASYAPQLLFGLWGGVLADRFDRRRILIITQVGQALGSVILGLLVVTDVANVANIAVLSFFLGIGFMLAIPTQQALVPSVVSREHLTSAINLNTMMNSGARVVGPLAAALLIGLAGIEWVFWINSVSFLAVIITWSLTPVARQPAMTESSSFEAVRAGIAFVRRTPAVAVPIGVGSFLMLFGVVYQPLAVVFATTVLANGNEAVGQGYFGWLQAGIGIGAGVAILATARIGRRRPRPTYALTAIAFSVLLALAGFATNIVAAVVLMVAVGGFHFANMTLGINLVQHEAPEVLRGRIMAIQMGGLIGAVPITALVGGWSADAFGIGPTMTGAGLICLAFSLVALRWTHHLRSTLVGEDDPPEVGMAAGALVEEEA